VQVVQVDSVNVLVRAQELPLWARLGPHRRDLIPRLVDRRELFECWGHEASICPVALHPLLRWRMEAAARGVGTWSFVARIAHERRDLVDAVLAEVRRRGPLAARELESALAPADAQRARQPTSWWNWSDVRRAVTYLFWAGALGATRRANTFERLYDLPERLIPPEVLAQPTPAPADAQRALLSRAARALGVATVGDLADYFRIKRPVARPLVQDLVDAGTLLPAAVDGWHEPAFLDRDAVRPRRALGATLVSPFDSLIWERARALRLFGFHYRIEIYTPAAQRRHGYYVLPFLHGDRLVARVDLKAHRAAGTLAVPGAFAEPDTDHKAVAAALAAELGALSVWLGLERVAVGARGDIAAALRAAVSSPGATRRRARPTPPRAGRGSGSPGRSRRRAGRGASSPRRP
jgi:uncharacterized protein YcaQ